MNSRSNSSHVAASYFTSLAASPAPQLSYYHHIGAEPLVYRTIGQQLERAARLYGDREAIVSCAQGKRLTYAQLLNQADRIAAGFSVLGLRFGDRFGIWSPNSVEWYVMLMACARAGLIAATLNPAYQTNEMSYCLRKIQINGMYAADTHKTQCYYDMLSVIVPELGQSDDNGCRIQSDEFPDLHSVIIDSKRNYP